MTRRQKDPLRELGEEEQEYLERVSRSGSAPASHVARAKALLAVAGGGSYTSAAQAAGRKSGDAVCNLVRRFNQLGMGAIEPGHGGGTPVVYGQAERERILKEARRQPDREKDGTASWSLKSLQRALRQAPEGLAGVSTYTIYIVLKEAGFSWQKDGSWCETGQVKRKRQGGMVAVSDPDGEAKKT